MTQNQNNWQSKHFLPFVIQQGHKNKQVYSLQRNYQIQISFKNCLYTYIMDKIITVKAKTPVFFVKLDRSHSWYSIHYNVTLMKWLNIYIWKWRDRLQ